MLTNFSMGLLYCWTLIASPIATSLLVSPAAVAAVPAVSLLAFTVGVNLYPSLRRRFAPAALSAIIFGGAVLGLALVAHVPSIYSIFLGFGAIFGLASGLGYGHAFALVTALAPAIRSFAIGACMTSFALTAIVLSFLVEPIVEGHGLQGTFSLLAIGLACIGGIVAFLLRTFPDHQASLAGKSSSAVSYPPGWRPMVLAFSVLCFAGLAIMANSTALLQDFRASPWLAHKGAAVFNGSYLLGSLCGAKVAEIVGGKRIVTAALVAQAAAILFAAIIQAPIGLWALIAIIGCLFGSTASIFPVYITQLAGAVRSTTLFPRLLIFYGIAGLLAPVSFVLVREYSGANTLAFSFLLTLTLVSLTVFHRVPDHTAQAARDM